MKPITESEKKIKESKSSLGLSERTESGTLVAEDIRRMGDADLVKRAQRGQQEAFEEIFRRYYKMVYQLGFRLCSHAEDAEELAQDTFVKAARALNAFRGDSTIKSWLWKIATNTAHDLRARRKRRMEGAEELKREQEVEEQFSPEGDENETQQLPVQAALDKLPAKQREALVMTIYEDMSHEEAAQILGCSVNTVSWRVHAAKKKLKSILSKMQLASRHQLGRSEQKDD